ncbi:MAG: hypothetical protein A3C43_08150 [Candidatus Schekmanbacteria bacterium RIFCSPHIGHO2_02_FULL_38_11]|uniref:Undecaprenyl-phosphate alpha-N-acetylglucosaminyl 1-phosphate transferase n=1 Tax=Candidatus Schekmanbacteria bacterium RIFCSPLOWO2_12_FULL_38_15 TaxID=1817883 RepID=A0A1F7SM09_9BACT|nr:MAG: hypothetical protein A2043_06805 [Candidatus Schekmanbacteria bacterium GWA2_38_9]OGL49960.1 MAG: hypothetical protein A3H37_12095 [Candidatus Schekmanbacteria bacterium RIFCSPLOWO2_02_FULL_38_14]OGL54596.1 MAG: hypothetical protein A3C43_08150 [Candidatus Schekmanbacteria bacterium RIFCSPHIGHO2_02_FULL_38_11]OGL54812.1 MAG: hypothetical protein A3G31_01715 [Candidatus Schekmanbacteria bacterium RIFCSPLOWO2_12_FULL_38_15]
MIVTYILTFFLSFFLSIYGTPIARKAATQYGIVDKPDGNLKTHQEPVPYLGGLSIYLAFLLSLSFTFDFNKEVLGIILAGTIIVLLGLIDDFGVLSPRNKFIGQFIATFILIKAGVMITVVALPHWLAIALTFFWIVGITNGFNIIDIMDGLSTGIAFWVSIFFFIVAVLNEKTMIATLTMALAGSLLGFLWYNFEPAKIYLGDAGSMFIGMILGSLAMTGSYSDVNHVGFIAPLIILGLPIFDTFLVMYIRFLRGQSVFKGSSDHFALRLRKWVFSKKATVIVSYGVTVLLGIMAIIMIHSSNSVALSIFSGVILLFLVTAYFLKKVDMGL